MSRKNNQFVWFEEEMPQGVPGQGMPAQNNAPAQNTPNPQNAPQNAQPTPMPAQQNAQPDTQSQDQNLEPTPDVPDNEDSPEFNEWRNEFFKLAVQGDTDKMLDSMNEIKEQHLTTDQNKFVDDNFKILLLRQDANFDKISKNIRRSLKTSLDQEHPGVSLLQIMSPEIESNPILSEIIIKLFGFHGLKGELHRKFIAALTGSIQVGGGGSKEDLVFNEKEYSINISTRIASTFGEISLGRWSLQEDDANKFLAEPEMNRLQEGSPEERKALVHRVIMESIADKFKTRAFVIHVVSEEGNVYSLGWDLGESIKDAYKNGLLVVKSDLSSDSDVAVGDDGKFIPLKNLGIFAKVNGGTLDDGKMEENHAPFIENRSGTLYFVADLETINSMGSNLTGMIMQSKPFTGSPEEFKNLTRCNPSLSELLLRRC